MGKFKVGDKVRVREDLEEGLYGSIYFSVYMENFRGKVYTIEIEDKADDSYKLAEINEYWWSAEMLEKVEYTYKDLCNSPIRN